MTRRLVVRPDALAELEEARDWYEARRAGLGADFVMEFDAALAKALDRPMMYPSVRGPVRRCILTRFPYAAYYRLIDDAIVVLAVVHGHRHPRVWRSRV